MPVENESKTVETTKESSLFIHVPLGDSSLSFHVSVLRSFGEAVCAQCGAPSQLWLKASPGSPTLSDPEMLFCVLDCFSHKNEDRISK